MNRFLAWRAGTKTPFDVPAQPATKAGEIDALESIPGLLKGIVQPFELGVRLGSFEPMLKSRCPASLNFFF